MNITLLILRITCAKDQFSDALAWIKSQDTRLYLAELPQKVWVLDPQCLPDDPAYEETLQDVAAAGWQVVAQLEWPIDKDIEEFRSDLKPAVKDALARSFAQLANQQPGRTNGFGKATRN